MYIHSLLSVTNRTYTLPFLFHNDNNTTHCNALQHTATHCPSSSTFTFASAAARFDVGDTPPPSLPLLSVSFWEKSQSSLGSVPWPRGPSGGREHLLLACAWNCRSLSDSWSTRTAATCGCDMTNSYMWRDSSFYVTWLVHICDMTQTWVPWLIHTCKVTHSWSRGTAATYGGNMTHSYVWRDSMIQATWLIHIGDMTHSWAPWLKHTCAVTQS